MSDYWSDLVRWLVPYVPGEQPRDRKFVKLNTNENPYPPSPLVIEAIKKAAGENLRLYPDPACTELREAVAARYGVKIEQVFAGNGSDEILAFAFAAFFGRAALCEIDSDSVEDDILFPDVTYSFYPVFTDLWGLAYRMIPLKDDFSIDIAPYLDISDGVVLPNPNAPTGMAVSLEDLRKIAEAAERNKRVLIVDEAYIAFADKEGVATALPLIAEFPNLLVIRTLSKEASLAGLRAAFAVGGEELIEGLCRVRDSFNSYTLDRLALAGAAAAVNDSSYYDAINRKVIATRGRVSAGLQAMGFRVLPSQANFIFAAPPSGKNGQEFFTALRERGFLVRHFNKPRIADFLRISIGTNEDMNAFLEACGEIIRKT
ncbi:MAG: aminotransferase class I/II-fold pyridoxal phosphate-dependent enzyme [Treponema sp.]|jgi:histidinol-phosphate aminotransferase|nr:aminotransferase class I/II-fold pyridoxal phosphate-dependent enzyme [Treponema sp.]